MVHSWQKYDANPSTFGRHYAISMGRLGSHGLRFPRTGNSNFTLSSKLSFPSSGYVKTITKPKPSPSPTTLTGTRSGTPPEADPSPSLQSQVRVQSRVQIQVQVQVQVQETFAYHKTVSQVQQAPKDVSGCSPTGAARRV